jgi:hypothetical protein
MFSHDGYLLFPRYKRQECPHMGLTCARNVPCTIILGDKTSLSSCIWATVRVNPWIYLEKKSKGAPRTRREEMTTVRLKTGRGGYKCTLMVTFLYIDKYNY